MRTITFNESTALKLYHELKNDTEIAKRVGKERKAIALWRKSKGLPSIAVKHNESVNYRDVLTPEQSEEMYRFLKCLAYGSRKAIQMGIKPDIGAAINGWRS